MISDKKKVYSSLSSFCTTYTGFDLPFGVFHRIWKEKQHLECINEEMVVAHMTNNTYTRNFPDVSFVAKGRYKYHKNGRKSEKIKRICKFDFDSRKRPPSLSS